MYINKSRQKINSDLLHGSGHYKVPAEYKPQNQPLQITGRSDPPVVIDTTPPTLNHTKKITIETPEEVPKNITVEHKNWRKSLSKMYHTAKAWINQQENKALKLVLIVLVGCIIAMFWYFNAQFKEFQQISQVSYLIFTLLPIFFLNG